MQVSFVEALARTRPIGPNVSEVKSWPQYPKRRAVHTKPQYPKRRAMHTCLEADNMTNFLELWNRKAGIPNTIYWLGRVSRCAPCEILNSKHYKQGLKV